MTVNQFLEQINIAINRGTALVLLIFIAFAVGYYVFGRDIKQTSAKRLR